MGGSAPGLAGRGAQRLGRSPALYKVTVDPPAGRKHDQSFAVVISLFIGGSTVRVVGGSRWLERRGGLVVVAGRA
jgi:hypothetical protein